MTWWEYKPMFVIKWREPYGFTRLVSKIQEKITPWWVRPLRGIVTAVVIFVGLITIRSDGISTLLVLFASIALGFGSTYFVALVQYFVIREIGLSEKALVTIAGRHTQGWPYEGMKKVEFVKRALRGKEYQLMLVTMNSGGNLTVGISKKIDKDKIVEFLRLNGVPASEI
jgi:hypothetical protein